MAIHVVPQMSTVAANKRILVIFHLFLLPIAANVKSLLHNLATFNFPLLANGQHFGLAENMTQALQHQSVFDTLKNNSKASLMQLMHFGGSRQLAVWRNSSDLVQYSDARDHAFSLYLSGGDNAQRVDGAPKSGFADAICIFPEGHSSHWKIAEGELAFMHLYVSDAELRAQYAMTHDRDARNLTLEELTLDYAQQFGAPLKQLHTALQQEDVLQAQTAFSELVGALSAQKRALKGGLAPRHLKQVDEFIAENISDQIRLSELAALVGLSEFHFQRSFTACRGVSPHKWVQQHRVETAKALLPQQSIAQVAAHCGFANQSHMNRIFKAQTGVTPLAYKKAMGTK